MTTLDLPQDHKRRAFGDFLRSRRERLQPADVGLSSGFRRRAKGLRREEVALLSGVGTTWYTWLEQGREVRASAEVLTALANALRLDPTERRHLFVLNDRPPPEARRTEPEVVPETLRRMLASMTHQPAQVLGRRWDILAWNRAAEVVFGDYARLDGDARNILHMVFADEEHRRMLLDWDDLAPTVLATFRADSARYAGDPDFERLIAKLMRVSPAFRNWWPKHDVARPFAGHKRITHPTSGEMRFEYTMLSVTGDPDMKIAIYTPLQDECAAKLERLLKAR